MSIPGIGLALFLGTVLNFAIAAAIALTAFWVEDCEPFFWIHNKLLLILGGVLIPLDFFPERLGWIARHSPMACVFYGPARLSVAFTWSSAGELLFQQVAWLALVGVMVALLYRSGVRQVNVNGG